MVPSDCRTASDVDALAERMFGAVLPFSGVSHVTALWGAPGGDLVTIAIGEQAPRSDHDFFALNLARARADAILVTGKVLRDEPDLVYALQGPGELPSALGQWREATGRGEPPWLAVLTSGRGLDPDHPAFHGWARPIVLTSPGATLPTLPDRVAVVRHSDLNARSAVAWLREDRGAKVVSLEAGPSTTGSLYETPLVVDELWLSVFRGELPEAARAESLFTEAELVARMETGSPPLVVDEPSGPWTFQRYVKRV